MSSKTKRRAPPRKRPVKRTRVLPVSTTLRQFLAGEPVRYVNPDDLEVELVYRTGVGIHVTVADGETELAKVDGDKGAARVYHNVTHAAREAARA